jgi:predicted transcriptional regulator
MSTSNQCAKLLEDIGLTQIESQIYVYLLQDSPATGYRIAKGISRSFTNTYKALSSLTSKGAVLAQEGRNKLYRAVPIEELFDQTESRLRTQRRAALDLARQLPRSPVDLGFYQLGTVDQVYERARAMLAASQERALIEIFPEPLEVLRVDIEQVAARGVDVTARIYEPATLSGVRLIPSPQGPQILQDFPSQWLGIFVDGLELLLAHLFVGGEGVYQAVWSANLFIGHVFFDYVSSDFQLDSLRPLLDKAQSIEEFRESYQGTEHDFPVRTDLGFQRFLRHVSAHIEGDDDE